MKKLQKSKKNIIKMGALLSFNKDVMKYIIAISLKTIDKQNLLIALTMNHDNHDNSIMCDFAAQNGYLELLKWFRKNGYPWDSDTCTGAALNGHLDILKWARENGCDWNSYTCAWAAENGHLEILKWARENGCEWGWETCAYVARNGHLDILKWAKENGCPES